MANLATGYGDGLAGTEFAYRPNKQIFYHNSDQPRETTPAKWIRPTGFW
jgi:hypothetical protein